MPERRGDAMPIPLLGGLFFSWGLTSVAVDLAVPQLKSAFDATYTQALLVQSAYFLAYAVLGRASGAVAARLGPRRTAGLGLGTMAGGCAGVAAATLTGAFAPILCAVFVIACGVTLLQVSANPLAAAGRTPDRAASRLTWLQALNSVGTLAAPPLAALVIYAGAGDGGGLGGLRQLFAMLAGMLAVLSVLSLRGAAALARQRASAPRAPLPPRVFLGAMTLFLYVGAEVSIGSTLINLLEREDVLEASRAAAASLVAVYWGGALTGRLLGAALMPRLGAGRIVGACALAACVLALATWQLPGAACAVAALAIGLCNGVQFPGVFALSLTGLDERQRSVASGWLCTAIVGGGVVPLAFGAVADAAGLRSAFLVPAGCYAVIAVIVRAYLSPQAGSAEGSSAATELSA